LTCPFSEKYRAGYIIINKIVNCEFHVGDDNNGLFILRLRQTSGGVLQKHGKAQQDALEMHLLWIKQAQSGCMSKGMAWS